MKAINEDVKNMKFHKNQGIFALASVISKKNKNFEDLTKDLLNVPFPVDIDRIYQRVIENKDYKSEQSRGIEDVRKFISLYESKKFGLKYDSYREIIIMPRGNFLTDIVFRTLINKGDEVIIGIPYKPQYINQIKLCGGIPKTIITDIKHEYKLMAQDISKNISKKTKAIILNPFDPCMSIYTKEELKEIANVCKKNNIFVISDERNDFLIYDDSKYISISTLQDMRSRTIVIKSFENKIPIKDFTFGYILADENISNQINKIALNTYESIDMLSQYIVTEFLKKSDYFDFVREKMRQKNKMFINYLKDNKYFTLDYIPRSGSCIMLNCKNLIKGKGFKNTTDLSEYLMRQKKYLLGTIPSVIYGMENYIVLYYNNIENSKVQNICQRLYGSKEEN